LCCCYFFTTYSWCGPCKELGPLLEEVAEELQVDVAKVDVDILPDLALEHNITSIPAVIAFSGGAKIDGFVGLRDKQFLANFVKGIS
jgi:thioredoxin 1